MKAAMSGITVTDKTVTAKDYKAETETPDEPSKGDETTGETWTVSVDKCSDFFNDAVEAKNGAEAYAAALAACRLLDRAVTKGVIHKNQAANRKSGIMKLANTVVTAEDIAAYKPAEKKAPAKTGSKKAAAKAARKEAQAAAEKEKDKRRKKTQKEQAAAAKKKAEAEAAAAAEDEAAAAEEVEEDAKEAAEEAAVEEATDEA